MVEIRGSLTGTHPLGEELIQSILDYKYGRSGKEPVKERYFSELKELVLLQSDLGFNKPSVGNLGIEDIIRPFTRELEALHSYEELGDLPINRYHYTNTFYRSPTIVEEFPSEGHVLNNDLHTLTDDNSYHHEFLENDNCKIIIPGPLTFVNMINYDDNSPYNSLEEFIIAAGEYLGKEINSLPNKYTEIQLDDPFLVWKRVPRTLRPAVLQAYQSLTSVISGRSLIVHTYFEKVENILTFLLELPVEGIGIDFTKTNPVSLSDYDFQDKILQVGLLDAQNYVPDDQGQLDTSANKFYSRILEAIIELSAKEVIVGPTTSLEYLPKDIADQRLEQVKDIISITKEEL